MFELHEIFTKAHVQALIHSVYVCTKLHNESDFMYQSHILDFHSPMKNRFKYLLYFFYKGKFLL